MAFTLPDLPFDPKNFSSFCSEETFNFHHGKHHATYVNKLNDAIKDTPMADMPLEDLIKKSHQEKNYAVYNNAAQHLNHSFFWNCFDAASAGSPSGQAAELINRDFGSFEAFKEAFTKAATTLFGSGWAWLVKNSDGKLEILQMKDADTPLILDKKPLLTLDVWEHAYYIDFRNARPDYISAFWKFVNWKFVEKNLG